MIQALNMPYSSKTDEIMSRYRPIAPKPEIPNNNNAAAASTNNSYDGPLVPEKFRQSPYLRNIWSHLQARPTRTRKRGRTSGIGPAAAAAMLRKQQQQQKISGGSTFMGLGSPNTQLPSHATNLNFQTFGVFGDNKINMNDNHHVNNINNNNIVELPLLSCKVGIDLNSVAETTTTTTTTLEERDLLLQLQIPATNNNNATTNVISPRPVRPVGSSISIVGPISEDPEAKPVPKTAEEVEEEVEAEALPAVVSDRGNKVRVANSAYKELVGQPECPWLDSMVISSGSAGRRISGEVMLHLNSDQVPVSGHGFSCWVRIEWESEGKKSSVNSFCDVVRLACESKDYCFCWRFHTREVSPSGSKV